MLIFGVLFSTLKFYFESTHFNTYAFMTTNLAIGLLVGMYFFYRIAYKSWLILNEYIDFEKLEKDIRIKKHNNALK